MPTVESIAVLMNHHTESRPLVSCWPPITPGTGAKCVGREFPALPGKGGTYFGAFCQKRTYFGAFANRAGKGDEVCDDRVVCALFFLVS